MIFATNFITDSTAKEWRNYITFNCKDKVSKSKRRISFRVPPDLKDEESFIHEACRAGVSLPHIMVLLQENNEVESLTEQGEPEYLVSCFVNPGFFQVLNLLLFPTHNHAHTCTTI
jgi:hypothetical protein